MFKSSGGVMAKYEYKHMRMHYRRTCSKNEFDEQIIKLLNAEGRDGWELKSTFHEGLLQEGLLESHIHIIFCREIAE